MMIDNAMKIPKNMFVAILWHDAYRLVAVLAPLFHHILPDSGPMFWTETSLAASLLLVAMPGAPSSVLAPSSKARSP